MASFFKAKLTSLTNIQVFLFTDTFIENEPNFILYKDTKMLEKPNIIKRSSSSNLFFFELKMNKEFEFGHRYYLGLDNFSLSVVDNSSAIDFPEFDSMFNYNGDDLGAKYNKKYTDFALWAPLSCLVVLAISTKNDGHYQIFEMIRGDKGIYRCKVDGDLENCPYFYVVNNNGVVSKCLDPYGIGTTVNSEASAVIDLDKINSIKSINCEVPFNKYTEAIIYETHVRDFTEDKNTDIINKGTFDGMSEKGRKTKGGHEAGIDYLKSLGITHVQLQPIYDYHGVDDITKKGYNWGYDPISYFSIEGSLSSNPKDPSYRLIEFKNMVNVYHEEGLRIILDVVYNHIYDYRTSCFEQIVPGYFFRKKKTGELYKSSGCGNDIASEKFMVRKLIIDSLKYFAKTFNIDGYRFDLMGLLDKTTITQCYEELVKIKPDIMVYGEGWNMYSPLPEKERGSSNNSDILPNYAFFNDMYRDIIKGPTSRDKISIRGFINGDLSYWEGFVYSFLGSVVDYTYKSRFKDANQSLNYIECHDNNTLFDKLLLSNPEEDDDQRLNRISFANSIILLSFGIPFLHMGQEIGMSKKLNDNSYNIEKINNLDWSIVDKRYDMVLYLKFLIGVRKSITFLKESNPEIIKDIYEINKYDNNVISFKIKKHVKCQYNDLTFIVNPNNYSQNVIFDSYHTLLTKRKDSIVYKHGIIAPNKIDIYYKP